MITDNMAVPSQPRPKLSYRLAMDEIDATDIAGVINESFGLECLVDGEHSFRKPGPKITESEVCHDYCPDCFTLLTS